MESLPRDILWYMSMHFLPWHSFKAIRCTCKHMRDLLQQHLGAKWEIEWKNELAVQMEPRVGKWDKGAVTLAGKPFYGYDHEFSEECRKLSIIVGNKIITYFRNKKGQVKRVSVNVGVPIKDADFVGEWAMGPTYMYVSTYNEEIVRVSCDGVTCEMETRRGILDEYVWSGCVLESHIRRYNQKSVFQEGGM